ncbi:zinc-dependent metalloprotease [Flavobacterium subsaxonicum]|uniref:P/Homo B domain-containing protein n=1 Tax=Flavobacterium subsaxonicum WB 4.1-42 = DSM 21790 TaxID=1121898 RepID=A0A0A2MH34_9FLAO|nr:zinc-dependent metalloprotease family protein [Flavobacterium subsaxonicum]KGO90926.1 hypothetical protein Q766_20750 [Flavobacterium subsaxonicum WB 4.1-42 = DSM 21790]
MKKQLLVGMFAVFTFTAGYAQSKSPWTSIAPEKAKSLGQVKTAFESANGNLKFVTLDAAQLKAILANAPQRNSGAAGVLITLPTVSGTTEQFRVFEASNFEPGLQAQFPGIRSYVGVGVEDHTAHLRMSFAPQGVQTMVLRAGKKTQFIEPYTANNAVYTVFTSADKHAAGKIPFECTTPEDHAIVDAAQQAGKGGLSDALTFKTFRLALSTTAEYTTYHGGTVEGALAAMNATMTRVNGVFEVDLAVNLILIEDEADIIYLNADTDPYSDAEDMNNWNSELQLTLTNVIGAANYDIGHLFGATGGGGNAGCIGCICVDNSKGSGITSPGDGIPEGDSYDIDYVAHEMGHQLGGTHSFSYSIEGSGTNVEPGSGSTIMGYAGITLYDVQKHSDDYFVYANVAQIQSNLQNKECAVNTTLTNTPLVINAGENYSIPKGTAFVLSAVGADANGDNVTYTWEQNNSAANTNVTGANSVATTTKTTGPTFRSFLPSTSTVRYFPAFGSVLQNELTTEWESVSNVTRVLSFALTGRDNIAAGGQTDSDLTSITVRAAAGPFVVTSQNTTDLEWQLNSQHTITWDVAGTTANNVNTENVKISLSTDGGATFATVLAESTPNDGSEVITLPAGVEGAYCRIMVQAVGNVYYALNATPFSIGVSNTCTTYDNTTLLQIPDSAGADVAGETVTSTITVADEGVLSDVNLRLRINHTFVRDLNITLTHPDGTEVTIWNRNCYNDDTNFIINFTDDAAPVDCSNLEGNYFSAVESLAVFNNKPANGIWTLSVTDNNQTRLGRITSWNLELCKKEVLSTPNFGLDAFAIYPNPNNGSFTVSFNSASQSNIGVTVNDISGRQVYSNSFTNTGMFSGNVDLKGVQSGVYLVTVQDGARKEVRKIVVN